MWPWEHVAFGYLAYSLFRRARLRGAPSADATYAAVAATLLPDLVDKPLAWWLHVLPAGRTLAHSLLVAGPLMVLAYLLARREGRGEVGVAFAVAYFSHLFADGVYPAMLGGDAYFGFLLWPIVPAGDGETVGGFAHLLSVVNNTLSFVTSPAGTAYVALEAALLGAALLLWLVDGWPGLPRSVA